LTPSSELPASPIASASYRHVRDPLHSDMIEGVFGDPTHLRLSVLVACYSLSAAPIREALNQFEVEGLLELRPNRGARRKVDEIVCLNRELHRCCLPTRFRPIRAGAPRAARGLRGARRHICSPHHASARRPLDRGSAAARAGVTQR